MAAITDVNYLLADSPKEEQQENLFASVWVCNCTERVYRLKVSRKVVFMCRFKSTLLVNHPKIYDAVADVNKASPGITPRPSYIVCSSFTSLFQLY